MRTSNYAYLVCYSVFRVSCSHTRCSLLWQEFIYYIAGSSLDEVKKSPFVEKLEKRGYEVLYLPEPVDEYCIQSLPEYKSMFSLLYSYLYLYSYIRSNKRECQCECTCM